MSGHVDWVQHLEAPWYTQARTHTILNGIGFVVDLSVFSLFLEVVLNHIKENNWNNNKRKINWLFFLTSDSSTLTQLNLFLDYTENDSHCQNTVRRSQKWDLWADVVTILWLRSFLVHTDTVAADLCCLLWPDSVTEVNTKKTFWTLELHNNTSVNICYVVWC